MHSEGSGRGDHFDGPVTMELLADLQAGLLDDHTAAGLRHRARTDPAVARQLETLDRVRRSVSLLGNDADSAPDVPGDVTHRIGTALRRRRRTRARSPAGFAAIVIAVAIGTTMLLRRQAADPALTQLEQSGLRWCYRPYAERRK